ncbi:hypothetical protein SFRURICE_008373 [Spodoptera frugiperda]|nr:hypothetical protein SFRURICE_008373 [Spodoptera frugiperda]
MIPNLNILLYQSHLSCYSFCDNTCVTNNSFFLKRCRGYVYKHTNPHANNNQTRNNNLRITQRVAPCGNQILYTLPGRQLLHKPCSQFARTYVYSIAPFELNIRVSTRPSTE